MTHRDFSGDLQEISANVERTYQEFVQAEKEGKPLHSYRASRDAAVRALHRYEDGDETCCCSSCTSQSDG